jgi:AmmeMemoRadiSam system protein B
MNTSLVKMYYRLALLLIMATICGKISAQKSSPVIRVKQYVDTVGFASHAWQMDSIMVRIGRLNRHGENLPADLSKKGSPLLQKAAICPHDDYVYAGWLYPEVLKNIHANTIILFGVAHKAKKFNIDNRLVFDTFDEWKEPYGNIRIPGLREDIIKNLPPEAYIINDSLQQSEHSVEAIIPYLQFFNRKIRIISILVPYMPYERMDHLSGLLATAIEKAMKDKGLKWGKDVAFVISTDAVHYGDEEWNGSNFAYYGCDEEGYKAAKDHEKQIIDESLSGPLEQEKIKKFTQFTLKEDDYKSYKWTWCGRYSVPLGLLTIMKMQAASSSKPLQGIFRGYGTSLDEPKIKVDDLRMGKTAIATLHHWVGYSGITYY